MAVTELYQAELRSLLIGAGTGYNIERDGISGFGSAPLSVFDSDRGRYDGEIAGPDVAQGRLIQLPIGIVQDEDTNVGADFAALRTAWKRMTDLERLTAQELALDLSMPWFPEDEDYTLRFYGRPRGLDERVHSVKMGYIQALCSFKALDPLGYGAEVVDNGNSGSFTINNAGDEATDRAVLTLTGSGGTPQLINTDDTTGSLLWKAPLAGGQIRVIDLRRKTVVSDTGVDKYAELAIGRRWFRLVPGDNDFTLSGATDVDFTYRPAWE